MKSKGRPSKFTPETQKRILDAIRMGATYELAAHYGGVTYETFNEWRKDQSDFSEAVKEAEGSAAVGWLAKIEKAASEGAWQAAAWKLERRYPHSYGRTVVDQRTTEVKIDWSTVAPELRDSFAEGKISLDDVLRQLQ